MVETLEVKGLSLMARRHVFWRRDFQRGIVAHGVPKELSRMYTQPSCSVRFKPGVMWVVAAKPIPKNLLKGMSIVMQRTIHLFNIPSYDTVVVNSIGIWVNLVIDMSNLDWDNQVRWRRWRVGISSCWFYCVGVFFHHGGVECLWTCYLTILITSNNSTRLLTVNIGNVKLSLLAILLICKGRSKHTCLCHQQ